MISTVEGVGSAFLWTVDPAEDYRRRIDQWRARPSMLSASGAICTACLVRGQCLALSLRNWNIGQHGVWGGLVPADRAQIR